MKWQTITRIIGLVGLGCFGMIIALPSLAQTSSPGAGLNAELSQAVCQQDWARAIRIVDRMRPLTPENRRGELTVYRSRLHAMLASQTTIPNLQCSAAGITTPVVTPRPSPSVANSSSPPISNSIPSPANNPATISIDGIDGSDPTIRGVRRDPNNIGNNNSSSDGVNPATGTNSSATGTNNLIDRARNLNQTIDNP